MQGKLRLHIVNAVRVVFNNGASAVDVTDTDPTHLLVKLGRVKWATIDVATTDTTAASTAGAKYLTEAGREQNGPRNSTINH